LPALRRTRSDQLMTTSQSQEDDPDVGLRVDLRRTAPRRRRRSFFLVLSVRLRQVGPFARLPGAKLRFARCLAKSSFNKPRQRSYANPWCSDHIFCSRRWWKACSLRKLAIHALTTRKRIVCWKPYALGLSFSYRRHASCTRALVFNPRCVAGSLTKNR